MAISDPIDMPRKDKSVYWDFARFNVGESQFQVPKGPFFLRSTHFSALYDLHEKNEIMLEGVAAAEFKAFLKVLFPVSYSQASPTATPTELTRTEWTSILYLSTRWKFPTLHALATKHLNDFLTNEPIQRILLGRTHNIRCWVHRGLCELVLRLAEGKEGAMISEAESEMLGHLATARIYQTYYEVSLVTPRSTGFNLEVARRVGERFADEFSAMFVKELEEDEQGQQNSSTVDADTLTCDGTADEGSKQTQHQLRRAEKPGRRYSPGGESRRRENANSRDFAEQEQHQSEQSSVGRRRSQVPRRHRHRWHAA